MARIELTFRPGVTTDVEINDQNLIFYAAQQKTGQLPDQKQVIVGRQLVSRSCSLQLSTGHRIKGGPQPSRRPRPLWRGALLQSQQGTGRNLPQQ